MNKFKWLGVPLLILSSFFTCGTLLSACKFGGVAKRDIFVFENVSGPAQQSILPQSQPTNWNKYQSGTHSRLAILLTEENSAWLGLAHGLKTIGVPFLITRDYRQALQHQVVLVYPKISGKVLEPEALRALAQFPSQGGTLIGVNVYGGGLHETFGFAEAVEARTRQQVKFAPQAFKANAFTDSEEQTISMGRGEGEQAAIGTVGYTNAATAIAQYEDGTAAITYRQIGTGHAYALGVDCGFLMLKSYGNRDDEIGRHYVNQYEPTLDMWLLWLRQIYEQGQRGGVTLDTVPFNRQLTVLLTHDVDFSGSVQNALAFAEYEKSQGLRATYFIQTKYIRDYNDSIFFDQNNLHSFQQLAALGMEIGSHTVCHSVMLKKQPLGTGEEKYPTYTPFVQDRTTVHNATLLGELRVSKFLLEHLLKTSVTSFRPGELSNPFQLPEALMATDYRYSSSVTANDSFTHLPFQLNYGRGYEAEAPVFEFPVTIEDEAEPVLGKRLPQALEVAKKISQYGGVMNILIHPNLLDHKLEFERSFVADYKDSAWFGTMNEFGQWWAARNEIGVDVTKQPAGLSIMLDIPQALTGLTLRIPVGRKYQQSLPANQTIQQAGDKIIIGEASGKLTLTLK